MPHDTAEILKDQIEESGSNSLFCIRCGRAGWSISSIVEVKNMREATEAVPAQKEYVRTLLQSYVDLPETPQRCHSLDRRIALELFERQIPVELVEAAFLLGSARRLARDSERALPSIRCLSYFLPVIEEVLAQPPPPDYIRYLRLRLKNLALIRR